MLHQILIFTGVIVVVFFFCKKKTEYEIKYGLVGAEMCKRDRASAGEPTGERRSTRMYWQERIAAPGSPASSASPIAVAIEPASSNGRISTCFLYTSDAADERSSVDLGGPRIIKKKKKRDPVYTTYDTKSITTQNNNEHSDHQLTNIRLRNKTQKQDTYKVK